MPPLISIASDAPESISCDALVVGAFAEGRASVLSSEGAAVDAALEGGLSEHLSAVSFKAKVGDVCVVPTLGRVPAKSIAVVGLGSKESVGPLEVLRGAGAAGRRLGDNAVVASALHCATSDGDSVAAAAEGFLLGSYRFTRYKSKPRRSKIERIVFLEEANHAGVTRGTVLAEATALARDLTNEPPSTLYPETLAARAREVAEANDLECTVLEEYELEARGFGGLLAVGRGSDNPPRLIQLRYAPKGATGKVILIGKGITFDSGGLSLKDAKNMEEMKTDMGGGAAVIGAISALARLQPHIEVVSLVAAAENIPSSHSLKPGDVITHYGGITSEVLNTDAEGRLVLADALAYASEQHPDAIVDAATLTGSIMVALGRKAAGLFSNDDALRDELRAAAEAAGERVWPMPLWDDYRSQLDSDVADIKNVGPRWGGAILAALFLREFVGTDVAWAHLDIAGPTRAETDFDEVVKGGTGVATRTLVAWVEGRSA
jgi:leucyl aminopeptidase